MDADQVTVEPASSPRSQIRVAAELSQRHIVQVRELVESAARADGVYPLNEHALLQLTSGGGPQTQHVLAGRGNHIVGYGLVEPADGAGGGNAELVVAPAHRRQGLGTALVSAMLATTQPLRLWAHGHLRGAEALAAALGFHSIRDLLQLRLDLRAAAALDERPELDSGTTVRTFVPGADDQAWLDGNRRAFQDHPEQNNVTVEDLKARMAQAWFDPSGFFLAERAGTLVGYHWTKVHDRSVLGQAAVGEVYVLGVDPSAQGLGLGRALTLVGLQHLRSRGLTEAFLYVDADNAAAIRTYQRLGFTHHSTDVLYCRAD